MNALPILRAWKPISLATGGAALLLVVFLVVAGFFNERIAPDQQTRRPGPDAPGTAVRAEAVEDPITERFPGSVASVREAAINSRIIARVQKILVRPGERVAEGTQLVVLDSRDLDSQYEQMQNELAGAVARLADARANYERMEGVTPGAVSRSQIDSAKAAFESADSEVGRMQNRLEEAQVALSYATIVAPYDAVVIDRFAEPGDLASPSRALLGVYDPSRMRLEAWVRESIAIGLSPGDSVVVVLDSLGEQVEGTVEEIVPQAEAGSRSFLVKVTLPKRDNLFPGMFGRLLLSVGTVRRVLVPQDAVTQVGQLSFVTLADPAATRRLVVPGRAMPDGRVEILSGVAAGESVVVP